MKRAILGLGALGFLLLALSVPGHAQSCVTASQVSLTGTMRSSNGLPSVNNTIALTPSQIGFIAGCGVNLPSINTCGTSVDGSVIQTGNPVTSTVNTTGGAGTLPAATYYTVYEFYDSLGHVTLPSPETRTILSVTGSLVVNPPASGIPATAAGMDVFISTTSGAETLQGQTTGSASFVQSTALVSGASPATTNNTVCVLTANDSIWPTGTGYNVSVTDSDGNAIPGFPMQWQLLGAGSTINISNGLPYYHGVVTYPVPILASPQNHGNQSISGNLSLGGYNLLNAGKVGIGTGTPGWPLDVENGLANFQTGLLIGGVAPTTGYCAGSSDGVSIDSYIACITSVGSIYYQTVDNEGTPYTQRPVIDFNNLFQVIDSASPPKTKIGLSTTGSEAHVVTAASSGASGDCVKWISTGGIGDTGGPCSTFLVTRTCNGNGCYQQTSDGTYTEWTISTALNNNTPTTVTLPHSIPTAILGINCTDNSSRVQSGNDQPIGANYVGLSAPYSTFYANTPASGVSALCTIWC